MGSMTNEVLEFWVRTLESACPTRSEACVSVATLRMLDDLGVVWFHRIDLPLQKPGPETAHKVTGEFADCSAAGVPGAADGIIRFRVVRWVKRGFIRYAQVCILDGNKYTSRCREAGEQRLEILDECEVNALNLPGEEPCLTLNLFEHTCLKLCRHAWQKTTGI
jgi:hypothetical protein